MKIIKTIFLISLFNFFIVGAIVLAMKDMTVSGQSAIEDEQLTASVNVEITITPLPTGKKVPNNKANTTDPFAIIFNQKEIDKPKSTQPPSQGNNPPNNTNTTQPTPDNRCVIAIDGTRYDVSVFRNQHSGGNIFTCGTDMSAIFHGQHPNSFLQKMARFKI